jgi:5-methylcytosine-specific restriction endonuclease McrA
MKSYYEANKEKIAEQHKAYREANKEKISEWFKCYYEANKEKMKSYNEANKEKIAERMKSYREAKALYKTYENSFFGEFKEGEDGVLLVKCKYCNKWFSPTNSEVKAYFHQGTSLYCSDGCKKSCPTYRVQKYEKGFRQNTSREVQPELRKLVLERDNWTCQKCGANKDNDITVTLHCHHIDPVKNNPIESADMDNCVTLCKACHKEVHKQKGCRTSDLAKCKIKE